MNIQIDITDKEYSILTNALEEYRDSLLDKAEYCEARPGEADTWKERAAYVKILSDKIQKRVDAVSEEERKLKLEAHEKIIIGKLIAWAKSDFTNLTFELEDLLDAYFTECHANTGMTAEDVIEAKQLLYEKLVIGCIYACNKEELERLDSIKGTFTA